MWLSRKQSKRSKSAPLGDFGNADVANANLSVARLVTLLKVCVARGVKFAIEQPTSSLLFEHPDMKELFRSLDDHWRLHVYLGSYGHSMCKGTVIWTNVKKSFASYFPQGVRPRFCEKKGAAKVISQKSGKVSVQGSTDLKVSEHYPLKFCQRFEMCFDRFAEIPKPLEQELYVIQKCGAPFVLGGRLLGVGSSDDSELAILKNHKGQKRKAAQM